MADEKPPVEPIVRKKDAPTEPAPEAQAEAAAPAEAPKPAPAPAPAKAAAKVPNLGRRVVDMSKPLQKARVEKVNGPASILTTSDEMMETDKPTVRVQDGTLADFEALLAEGGAAPPRVRVDVGDQVSGTVATVGGKWAYIDLGEGREGVARMSDFEAKDGTNTLVVGETRDFFVLGTSEGTITLGDQLSTRDSGIDAIETAAQSGIPLSGRVMSKNKGGFEIDLGGARAFCPISQIELAFTENPDEHIGCSYQFRVMEVRDGGRSIVVSRAELMREEQARAAAKMLETIEPGMVVAGTVTRLADFGAFIDIGGVEGLAHVSELGFTRVEHPSEVLREGETVQVKVLSIEEGDKGLRIGLSLKETLEDPWEGAMKTIFAGAKVQGTVNRLEPFGAFVEVAPNVEGLVHVSEMSWEKHVKRPSDIVSVGQIVDVEVLDVDLPRHRISLSMKGGAGDPWSKVSEMFVIGQDVEGTIENIEDFGVFVGLGGGITALLPRSEMGLSGSATPHAMFKRGDSMHARILAIEPARQRMSLTLKSTDEIADAGASGARNYSDAATTGLGTFGDLFKDKLK